MGPFSVSHLLKFCYPLEGIEHPTNESKGRIVAHTAETRHEPFAPLHIFLYWQLQIQDFLFRGADPLGGVTDLRCGRFSVKICKNERIGSRGGGWRVRADGASPGSANDWGTEIQHTVSLVCLICLPAQLSSRS